MHEIRFVEQIYGFMPDDEIYVSLDDVPIVKGDANNSDGSLNMTMTTTNDCFTYGHPGGCDD